jgi:[acyl-carrier-protein] S-malonyltransferase
MGSSKPLFAFFPGQGSQHVGMTKDLYENFAIVRQCFEEASDAISADVKKLCFDGPESDLILTHNTQPCLVTSSVASFRAFQSETGFTPTAVMGHSLGEYSALVAAEAIDFSAAVRWVRKRGLEMQSAVKPGQGSMAAVLGLESADILKLCETATANAKQARQPRSNRRFRRRTC